jgi:hypothetical protein
MDASVGAVPLLLLRFLTACVAIAASAAGAARRDNVQIVQFMSCVQLACHRTIQVPACCKTLTSSQL